MKREGLNQTEFAQRLGVKPQQVNKAVHSDEGGSKDFWIKVLKWNKSINAIWLLTGEGEMFLEKKSEAAPARTALLDVAGGLLKLDASGLIARLERLENELSELREQLAGLKKG